MNQGAGLDFGLALAPNTSVSACSSVSLCCVSGWSSTLSRRSQTPLALNEFPLEFQPW